MKFNKMKMSAAWLMSFLGIEKFDIKDNKVDLSQDQRTKIEEKLGAEQAQKLFEGLNAEIQASEQEAKEQADLQAVLNELGTNATEDAPEGSASEDKGSPTVQATEVIKNQKKQIEEMAKQPIEDAPEAVFISNHLAVANGVIKKLSHNATHIFSLPEAYNAFENRPWNQRLRDNSPKASAFSAQEIPVLQGDMDLFVRQNPEVLQSLFFDNNGLPKEWDIQTGVVDIITEAGISVGEIVQARSDHWAPKNKFVISVEAGKVWPKKIDIEFSGPELQKLETTWIRSVANLDGSHPWKMSFIGFIVSELLKQQQLDDRRAQVNGIYVPTPAGQAGSAINSQDGLMYLFYKARDVEKKYRPFPIGLPTADNAVEYVQTMIEMLPEDVRNMDGLEFICSNVLLQWYKQDAALRYSHKYDTDEGKYAYSKMHPIDYPNIIFQPLKDMTNTLFCAITYSKNIQVLEYDPSEKGKFTVGHDKRDTWLFADYRLGIRLKRIGLQLAEDHPDKYVAQMVWSNEAPIFSPTYKVPVYDDKSGILKVKYDNMIIGENFTNDIVKFQGATVGRVIKITGNPNLASATVAIKDNSDNDLASDFTLKTEGTITLYVNAEGKVKELARTTTAPVVVEDEAKYSTASIDANQGKVFRFDGSAALTVTNILNGVSGKEITIYGGAGGEVTVAQTGNIKLGSALTLTTAAKFVKLVSVEGTWHEIARG